VCRSVLQCECLLNRVSILLCSTVMEVEIFKFVRNLKNQTELKKILVRLGPAKVRDSN